MGGGISEVYDKNAVFGRNFGYAELCDVASGASGRA